MVFNVISTFSNRTAVNSPLIIDGKLILIDIPREWPV